MKFDGVRPSGTSHVLQVVNLSYERTLTPDLSAVLLPAGEVVEVTDDLFLHFLARHGGVNQAVFDKEFSGLKTGRQVGVCRVFDHARAGKTNHRGGFGENQIAERGKASHHAAATVVRQTAVGGRTGPARVG